MPDPRTPSSSARVGLFQASRGVGGGRAYELEMERALRSVFQVEARNVYPRHFTSLPLKRFRQIASATRAGRWDVTIRGFITALALGIRPASGRQVVLIHHLDHSEVPHTRISALLERFFNRALERTHRLVVVSPFWKAWFQERFPKLSIDIIHNAFAIDDYVSSPEDLAAFRLRFGFDERPLIYLGNCQRAKGVVEAYEALKDSPYQLVTSGRRDVDLPCPHVDSSMDDYRLLLGSADVVLAVSRFLEGWHRTAHESLLAGTPVVGFRAGGLGDLLEGAGQIQIQDTGELLDGVRLALRDRKSLVDRGRQFAREFTVERFADSWKHLVEEEAARA